jgi:hypothetical protein
MSSSRGRNSALSAGAGLLTTAAALLLWPRSRYPLPRRSLLCLPACTGEAASPATRQGKDAAMSSSLGCNSALSAGAGLLTAAAALLLWPGSRYPLPALRSR